MAVNPSPFGPKPQFEISAGTPAVGNKLFFYVAGSVNTKQNTFTDSTGGSANTNPIILDALGMPTNTQIWFTAGLSYKVVYAPSTDTDPPTSPIWTIDNLTGINDTTSLVDQWIPSQLTPTFISATSFSLPGDQTITLHAGRRLKTLNSSGTIYSSIFSATFAAAKTTFVVVNDSGVLDSGISSVSYGLPSVVNTSLPLNPQGVVKMVRVDPTATDVSWKADAPNGLPIEISATTTDGFAEAHTYAVANFHSLIVEGGGISTAKPNANVINFASSTRQTLGPADCQVFDIRGVNFNFAGQGLTNGTALVVDSFSKGLLNFDGQVVCNHAGTALEFNPSTNYDSDSNKNQGVGTFVFRNVTQSSTAANSVAVSFNAPNGESLNGSNYSFEEINGGLIGVLFTTAGTGVITGCRFNLWGIHDYKNGAGGIGVDTSGATALSACKFVIEITTPASADWTAKINSDKCEYSIFDLTAGNVKILLDTSATGNEVHIFAPNTSGLTLTDNSAVSSNRVWFNGVLMTGLSFPATQYDSTDANTFDDYEEGTATPVVTFATVGNLVVVYSNQAATYTKSGRDVRFSFSIQTSTFTHTTASGDLKITGFPFAAASVSNLRHTGALVFQGITKAGFTNIVARIANTQNFCNFMAGASATAASPVDKVDVPSAGTVILESTVVYQT